MLTVGSAHACHAPIGGQCWPLAAHWLQWNGVDVGGERSASAVLWCTEDLRVGCTVFHGDRAVLECADKVRELAETYTIAEYAFDPWRFEAPALELAERGISVVAFPQSDARMVRRPSGCTPRSSKGACSTPTILS